MKIQSIKLHIKTDTSLDTSYLGSYSNEPKNRYSIERENAGHREYRYFNPVAENLIGETEERARKIAQMDFERIESLNNGQWCYVGIYAVADIVSDNGVCQQIRSGGLWGIESDSDKDYLDEVKEGQLGELRAELVSFGFVDDAIDLAFQDTKTKTD